MAAAGRYAESREEDGGPDGDGDGHTRRHSAPGFVRRWKIAIVTAALAQPDEIANLFDAYGLQMRAIDPGARIPPGRFAPHSARMSSRAQGGFAAVQHKSDVGGVILGMSDAPRSAKGWRPLSVEWPRQVIAPTSMACWCRPWRRTAMEMFVGATRDR